MNREEAAKRIEYLKFKAEVVLANNNTESVWLKAGIERTITALTMASEELGKQQTTKYKHLGTRHTHWGKCRHDKFMCENCGFTKEFTNNHTSQYQYCPSCGRKIDWRKPKGNDCDVMFIDEVIAYDTQKKD